MGFRIVLVARKAGSAFADIPLIGEQKRPPIAEAASSLTGVLSVPLS